jgi:HNH endonuclease
MTTPMTAPPRLIGGQKEAFWARVKQGGPDECWPWLAYIGPAGYGTVKWRGRMSRAHRIAYTLAVGPIPEGLDVLHSCDNPACCNPGHLRPGTQLDNMRDRSMRGRAPGNSVSVGEKHVRAKLTNESVQAIRSAFAAGTSAAHLSRQYKVNQSTISQVVNRITWKHIA